jgi:hypothetical protein
MAVVDLVVVVTAATRIALADGDLLVFHLDGPATPDRVEEINEQLRFLKQCSGVHVYGLILADELTVEKVDPADMERLGWVRKTS